MRHAVSKSGSSLEPKLAQHVDALAVPTFIATDLLEKLIVDRDAWLARKIVTEGRRH